MDTSFLELAAQNQKDAHNLLASLNLESAWHRIGATTRLVGSLRTGLLMKHLDIDLHVYSPTLRIADSFEAMRRIAEHPRVRRIEYENLLAESDRCLEWHIECLDERRRTWHIDLIHMESGSTWDGHFEEVADRIAAVLTDETREAILRLKYETPDDVHIPGILYAKAVLRDGIRTGEEFEAWCIDHAFGDIDPWMP